ncbi:PepSY domain-containing protein [Macrococcus sp. EM39E]|uniref:PepSY domain-containing protein n=2 Tax=Macrococcus animalis TaxID=3395467 RepID=UPI0039BEB127
MNILMKKLLLIVIAITLLCACNDNNNGEISKEKSSTNDIDVIKENAIKTDVNDAIKTAKKEVIGDLESISFAYDDQEKKWLYKVNLKEYINAHEVKIDAMNNEIIDVISKKEDDKVMILDYKNVTPVEEIIKIAQRKFDGDIIEWRLDIENANVEYYLKLFKDGKYKEFEIDATTKEILN